jgi:hypothetical protein
MQLKMAQKEDRQRRKERALQKIETDVQKLTQKFSEINELKKKTELAMKKDERLQKAKEDKLREKTVKIDTAPITKELYYKRDPNDKPIRSQRAPQVQSARAGKSNSPRKVPIIKAFTSKQGPLALGTSPPTSTSPRFPKSPEKQKIATPSKKPSHPTPQLAR